MERFRTLSFEQPLPEPDEERELSDEPDRLPERIKLGTAWSCVTMTGIVALVYSAM